MICDPIRYSLGFDKHDNTPSQQEAADFSSFARAIRSKRSLKKGQMYFCGPMAEGFHDDRRKYPNTATYRLSRLALPRRFLCLDHDGYKSPVVFKNLIQWLGSYGGFGYETFSSSPDAPRARIVLELDRPVSRPEGIALGEAFDTHLKSIFGEGSIKSDPCVYRAEQQCFSPGEGSQFFIFEGEPLKIDKFLGGGRQTPSKCVTQVRQRRRPTSEAIIKILENIDPFPEPIWFKVACILARVYGEDGRELFLSFSKGDYWSIQYRNYNEKEANLKFNRAINEVAKKESGAGVKALIKMANSSIHDVDFEDLAPGDQNDGGARTNEPSKILMSEFGLIILGGQIRVVRQAEVAAMRAGHIRGAIGLYQRGDAELMMKRCLVERELTHDLRLIRSFFHAKETTVYEATAFSPLSLPENVLNYWIDPISPIAGSGAEPVYEFIEEVICASNKQVTKYLLDFLAHMLQHPEVKPGIAIVLLGGQGIGKGTFFSLLRAIWRRSVLVVQDVDQVVGKYNSALERHFVVCMDEAIFRGDRKASEKLKALVTEPLIRIEAKYEPTRTIESFHRFFAATNSNHFGQVDADDRRYLFLRVSNHKRCRHDYFSELHRLFQCDEIMGAFVHDLTQRNIESVNIFARPITEEHTMQRVHSLNGFDRFWHDFLVGERVAANGMSISTEALMDWYKEFNRREDSFAPLQTNQLSRYLREMCPSATKTRIPAGNDASRRGYSLPPLAACRDEFERYIGAKLDWDIFPGVQPKFDSPF